MRNPILFVLIVLVLGLVGNASADLVAHYKFDGDAKDSSGYGHDGTEMGGPSYGPGMFGLAINLDGVDDYVIVGSVGISGNAPRTIAGWVRANSLDIPDWTNVFGFTNDTEQHYACFDIEKWGYGDHYAIHAYYWERAIIPLDLDWHHLAATYDGTTIAWYGDGALIGSENLVLNTIDNVHIGKRADTPFCFPGLIDDVRIYDKALSLAEIIELIHNAYNPNPVDGAVDVSVDTNLTWTPGYYAAWHEVYLGTDSNALQLVDTKPLGDELYQHPGGFSFGQTYYWQIVEVNDAHPDSPWPGSIWHFRTYFDCNGNLIPDPVDIATGTSLDCNGNGIPDECDIADGTSQDINGNGIPDECDPDCNGNGVPDDVDIATSASLDCNGNDIPDECELGTPIGTGILGSIISWGGDDYGQIRDTPSGNDFMAIAAGDLHSLAIRGDGTIVPWGQTGDPPSGNDFTAISIGRGYSLALRSDGSIVSWGWDDYDQVSDTPSGNDFTSIAAGLRHSLAIRSDGSIVSWGWNYYGQVSGTPSGNGFTAIAAGNGHSLAIRSDGSIVSWGWDENRQVRDTPSSSDFVAIEAGDTHSVALRNDGSIVSWGWDAYGQVSNTPSGNDFIAIAAGGCHSLAIRHDGSIISWGYDNVGQVSNTPSGNNFVAIAASGQAKTSAVSNK